LTSWITITFWRSWLVGRLVS